MDFPFRVTDLEHAIINLRSQAPILLLGRSGTGTINVKFLDFQTPTYSAVNILKFVLRGSTVV